MAFVVKDWRNATTYAGGGDESTPLSAEALEDLEERVTDYVDERLAESVFNVRDYGATGDGSTDDLSAFTAAIAALPSSGGTILVPDGDYILSGPISFDETISVTLAGMGGKSSGAQTASRLVFTASGSTSQLAAKTSAGFTMRDIQVLYTNASYSGSLISLAQSASGFDTAYTTFDRCFIGGSGVRGANCLSLDKAIICKFNDCTFASAGQAVEGRTSSANYSNVHTFDNCAFVGNTVCHVGGVSETWTFIGCAFEHLSTAGGVAAGAGAISHYGSSAYVAEGLTMIGCWFGDATAVGTWIDFNGQGLYIAGCHIGGGEVGVRLGENSAASSVVIQGNYFDACTYGIGVYSNGVAGATLQPNYYTGISAANKLFYVGVTKSGYDDISGANIASAATITVPDVPLVTVTGTTAITSITAGGKGQRVTLMFTGTAGTTGLTDGSNLKLGSNFVHTADDTISLICDGTNWYETGRSTN